MAGRSMPLMRPIPRRPAVTAAPVDPGATREPHSPLLTSRAPTETDASFFLRKAMPGCSPISIT